MNKILNAQSKKNLKSSLFVRYSYKYNLCFHTGKNTNKNTNKEQLSKEQTAYLFSLRLFRGESLKVFSDLDFIVKVKYFNSFSIESVYFIELNFESIKELMFNLC